ncbi:hypothetical protein ABT063_15585 [Streptomyces sp. NPDC002838]|uniref:hypothetical protein n=1 Tax=Streptomyces sp. NPDC002838 TaxID=3154436 RepID=UPI00332A4E6F
MTESTSAVEQAVHARIAAARVKVQAARERRESLTEARKHGLARRHAQKLRRQADTQSVSEPDAEQQADKPEESP